MEMRTINLDGMFVPVSKPEIEFETFKFPGGELHIKLNNNIAYHNVEHVLITHRIKNMDDVMLIMLAQDALKQKGVERFSLVIPYVPYARQDRICNEGESFSLKVFANLINSLNFYGVLILDPHSGVAPALINNSVIMNMDMFIMNTLLEITTGKPIHIVSPDSGSNKKIHYLATKMNSALFSGIISCDKERDLKTGKLTGFKVFADDLLKQDCLIIDDICDGGGTFVGLAEELKKKNAGDIFLYVSHGIFSKGFEDLQKNIKKIYTTNSVQDIPNFFVKQFKIQL